MENSHRERMMMLDPVTAKARVFVKNLPLNSITKHDVEDHFGKYGKISGMLLQKHFSFIQFEENQAAQDAIDNENNQVFHGKILEVAHARMPLDKAQLAAQRAARGGGNGGGRGRDRSPLRDDEPDWRDDPYDYDYRGGGGGRGGRPGPPAYREEDYYPETRTVAPPIDERANDCEIIVHNKKQRGYAEMIERKLKGLGLTVDLLFPNDSIPVTRVLANVSTRGTLYAITISPQNEELRSLTVNILHGIAQEHRNMPLEQALALINRNFEAFVSNGGQRKGVNTIPTPLATTGPAVITPHPDSIQGMLNLLAQNRSLTVLQYDTLLRYLTQRREQQVMLELGDPSMAPAPPLPDDMPSSTVSNPQAELLRNRILNIMQKKGISTTSDNDPSSTSTWPATTSAAPSTAPILHDPNVQRALDNLFQGGNLLDKINAARN